MEAAAALGSSRCMRQANEFDRSFPSIVSMRVRLGPALMYANGPAIPAIMSTCPDQTDSIADISAHRNVETRGEVTSVRGEHFCPW